MKHKERTSFMQDVKFKKTFVLSLWIVDLVAIVVALRWLKILI